MRSATGPPTGCRALGLIVVLRSAATRATWPTTNNPRRIPTRVKSPARKAHRAFGCTSSAPACTSPRRWVPAGRRARASQPRLRSHRHVPVRPHRRSRRRAGRVTRPRLRAGAFPQSRDRRLPRFCVFAPCSSDPNEQRRAACSRRYSKQLILYFGTGSRPHCGPKRRRWRLLRRKDSRSGCFHPYVFMANTEKARRAWMLVRAMVHCFDLRHPHGPQAVSRAQVAAQVCRSDLGPPIDLLDDDWGFVADSGMPHLCAIDAVGALWSMSRPPDTTARENHWGWLGQW